MRKKAATRANSILNLKSSHIHRSNLSPTSDATSPLHGENNINNNNIIINNNNTNNENNNSNFINKNENNYYNKPETKNNEGNERNSYRRQSTRIPVNIRDENLKEKVPKLSLLCLDVVRENYFITTSICYKNASKSLEVIPQSMWESVGYFGPKAKWDCNDASRVRSNARSNDSSI